MAIPFDDIWNEAASIEGWLTESQARALYAAAREVSRGQAIVEIGSHHGRSTLVLAAAAPSGVLVHAVDPFDDPRWGGGGESLARFRRNLELAGVADVVEHHQGLSSDAARHWNDGAVGLLFIDGAHDRESVLADIDGWQPHLGERARVYMHDAFSSPGVTRALLRRFATSRHHRYIGSERSLAMFELAGDEKLPMARLLVNRARLTARLAYFARNAAVKLAHRSGKPKAARLLGWREPGYPY